MQTRQRDAERHKSRVNIVALWDILLAITPTEAEVEPVFSRTGGEGGEGREDRIMHPGRSKMSASTLIALTLLNLALTMP